MMRKQEAAAREVRAEVAVPGQVARRATAASVGGTVEAPTPEAAA